MSCRHAGTNIFTGAGGPAAVMDEAAGAGTPPPPPAVDEGRNGQASTPLDPPGPSRPAVDLRNDAAEEERRQKLRQVWQDIISAALWIMRTIMFVRQGAFVIDLTKNCCLELQICQEV